MSDLNFYAHLPTFRQFEQFCDERHYYSVPLSWSVVICDIVQSTKAIEAGRYKDVNLLGAACIAALQEKIVAEQLPFVFGGDGASFLLPNERLTEAIQALYAVQQLAEQNYGLQLRIGAVSMTTLAAHGQTILVAKYALTEGLTVAKFSGGGLSFADDFIKRDTAYLYHYSSVRQTLDVNLANLSCRWQPIPSQRGHILTLLVKAEQIATYQLVMEELNAILQGDSSPVSLEKMTYSSLWHMLVEERHLLKRLLTKTGWARLVNILLCYVLFRRPGPWVPAKIKHYTKQMALHSDYRKFDDTLRMVLDVTSAQVKDIEACLTRRFERGELIYGTFLSDSALMTCLVKTVADDEHIHFIDGNDGGYAVAAQKMKRQRLLRQ